MYAPSPLLLLWCGLAATIGAAITGTIIGGSNVAAWSLAPRPRSFSHAARWSLLAGLLAYPLAYGLLFEALHRADLRAGALVDTIHGAVMFIFADPRIDRRNALRVAAAHLLYAVTIAFLYVTP